MIRDGQKGLIQVYTKDMLEQYLIILFNSSLPQLYKGHHAFHFQTAMQKDTKIRALSCHLIG